MKEAPNSAGTTKQEHKIYHTPGQNTARYGMQRAGVQLSAKEPNHQQIHPRTGDTDTIHGKAVV